MNNRDLTIGSPIPRLTITPTALLERCIPREKGPAHGAPLGGRDQLGHDLAVLQVRNVADVGGDEPIRQAIHLSWEYRNHRKTIGKWWLFMGFNG